MEPTTAAMIAKIAIAMGANKKVWTGIASVIVGICIPFILAIVCILNLASAAADHNRAAVRLAFHGGFVPLSMPADYKEYIYKMQQSFEWIDSAMDEIDAVAEGDVQDRYLVKAVFYSLCFGEDWLWLGESDYQRFAESFVKFEDRTRIVTDEEGGQSVENYQASIAITDKVELFERIKDHYGVEVTYEQQANAMNVWHIAKYNTTAMQEGDALDDGWANWNGGGDVTYYDLPASEVGGKVVELAMSRLGHPYSQTYRGKDNYVDCSYLTLWCYRQVGIILPGTAAEQGRYLVEHNLTIAKEDLQPGDLVFWSYKPNGRFMNITHVGIYAGDGKVVDASYSKGKVVYRNLFDEDKQVLYGRPQRLFVEVYNAKKLEGKLKNVVHECREDLVLVYRLSGYDERLKRDCDSVTEEQMTRWGVDVETLKRDAWANTMAKRPPIMIDMMDACHLDFSRKHLENDNPAPGGISPLLDMFIITNRMNNNGAIYMFDDETMQRVAGKLGDNLIILPSSVHETIVYSEECGPDIRRAKDMVQAVNQTELREEDFLSGEIYRYDKDSHTLSKVQVPEHEEIFMPDKVSMEEMHAYGYVWDGMLPLTKERALELMDTDLLLFKLYEDGAEGMIETKEEILSHDGLFGVERDSWMNYLNAQSQNETNGMTLEM